MFSSLQLQRSFHFRSIIEFPGNAIPLSNAVKSLRVILDSNLTFRPHINKQL